MVEVEALEFGLGRGGVVRSCSSVPLFCGVRGAWVAATGMYRTFLRCIESFAHILLHFRNWATVIPYLRATPARESLRSTFINGGTMIQQKD
jgi:hypothetical protein